MFRMPASKFSGCIAVYDPDAERGKKLTALLTTLDLHCMQVSSLDELGRCFDHNKISLVMADNEDGTGLILASTMRAHPLMIDVPLMLLTDQSVAGALQRDLICAPDALVHKPFTAPHLINQLNKLAQNPTHYHNNKRPPLLWRLASSEAS